MDGVDNESRISRGGTCSDRISCADGRACYTVLFLLSRAQGCVCEAGGKERILYAM